MFFDVGCGLLTADLWQARAPGIEPLQDVGDGALRAPIRFGLVRASGIRVSLAGVRLGGILPDDIGVLGARTWLVARADLSGVISGVGRETARGGIAVIGLIPGAAQFGHVFSMSAKAFNEL
jgi:hypothetical protein